MTLTIEEVKSHLVKNQRFLTQSEGIAYFCYSLLQSDGYSSGLIEALNSLWNGRFVISDCIASRSIDWLYDNGFVTLYEQKLVGRGRPRTMMRLNKSHQKLASELAGLWLDAIKAEGS